MSTLTIKNLPRLRELDQAARAALSGGQGYMDYEPLTIRTPEPGLPPGLARLLRELPVTWRPPVDYDPLFSPGSPRVVPL
ncbi:hypothetical protein [Cupriavidus sp. IDO]|uniref:hypothetical protein n=1 Tax=Cupriavidus sp. IDO TaxID=1539142 RepID=UPI000578F5AB|nr:hypothetical protein [Cupriavidus sp. IDO]KWR88010.1 hypothetical protein RM96_21905 [Cupriavidus sp. IDO]